MSSRKEIIKDSLSDRAFSILRESIISLEYPPGTRFVIDRLAESLSISRTPIREALRELVNQGLVVYDRICYRVVSLRVEDVLDIFAIRKALEVLAAGTAAQRITPAEKGSFKKILDIYSNARSQKSIKDFEREDQQLHTAVRKLSHNPRLFKLLSSYQDLILFIRSCTLHVALSEKDIEATNREHKDIVMAIVEEDSRAAGEAMRRHLENSEKRTIATMKKAEG